MSSINKLFDLLYAQDLINVNYFMICEHKIIIVDCLFIRSFFDCPFWNSSTFKMAAPMYNMFVGSETGLLKGINTSKDTWRNINNIETPDKSNEIRSLLWIGDSQSNICIGLRNKRVANYDVVNQRLDEFEVFNCGESDLRSAIRTDKHTITGLENGIVALWEGHEVTQSLETGKSLTCMTLSNFSSNTLATGGKESDLKVWDLSDVQTPTFQAKNVKNDWLNLRVPIWITAAEFLDEKKIVTSTGTCT